MRIAQVAPLYESVPPKYYGGTERVVSYLTEELVREGHDVTLFASGDSVTRAALRPMCDTALRLGSVPVADPIAPHIHMVELVAQQAHEFDIVHFHVDYLHFPVTRREQFASVTTLHGRLDLPAIVPVYREFPDMSLVSISDSQRAPLQWANWAATVHHGLPDALYVPNEKPTGYFAFIGRISPEKRVDRAIELAKRVGVPLKIAAKIDPSDREYYENEIKHLMDDPLVEFVGEIGEADKSEFLGNARALLMLIDWEEPFGLVMVEAMACATPVIAFNSGSVPEVIDEGVTGFIVNDMDAAVEAAGRIPTLDRSVVRRVFEQRFSARRMAADYLEVYAAILDSRPKLDTGESLSSLT